MEEGGTKGQGWGGKDNSGRVGGADEVGREDGRRITKRGPEQCLEAVSRMC